MKKISFYLGYIAISAVYIVMVLYLLGIKDIKNHHSMIILYSILAFLPSILFIRTIKTTTKEIRSWILVAIATSIATSIFIIISTLVLLNIPIFIEILSTNWSYLIILSGVAYLVSIIFFTLFFNITKIKSTVYSYLYSGIIAITILILVFLIDPHGSSCPGSGNAFPSFPIGCAPNYKLEFFTFTTFVIFAVTQLLQLLFLSILAIKHKVSKFD